MLGVEASMDSHVATCLVILITFYLLITWSKRTSLGKQFPWPTHVVEQPCMLCISIVSLPKLRVLTGVTAIVPQSATHYK